jgi:hypothetical protein
VRYIQKLKYPLWVALWNFTQQKILILIVLVLAGVTTNVFVLSPTLNQTLLAIRYPNLQPSFGQPLVIVLIYFGVGIMYSTYTSLLLRPKKLVSPLIIQIITTLVLLLMIANYATYPEYVQLRLGNTTSVLTPEQQRQNSSVLQQLNVLALVLIMMLPIAGWVQRYVVRILVGVNGTDSEKDLYKRAFSVPMPYVELRKLLTEESFLQTYSLSDTRKGNFLRLQGNDGRAYHIITATLDSENEAAKAILSIVSYEMVTGNITNTTYAQNQSNGITDTIEGKISRVAGRHVPLGQPLPYQPEALGMGVQLALEKTKPRILEIKEAKRYAVAGILLTIVIGAMTYLYYSKYIPIEVYVSSVVLIGITVILELMQLLRAPRHES